MDKKQEHNLQSLLELVEATKDFFTPVLASRSKGSALGDKRQERVDTVLAEVKKLNAKLTTLLDYGRTVDELDAFFDCIFSPKWLKDYGKAQDELLKLFEKGRDQIQLKPYVRVLRVAQDSLSVFKPTKALGKKIYTCLEDEAIMADVTDGETIQTYYSKQGYGVTMDYSWENPIKLLAAVKQEYKDK